MFGFLVHDEQSFLPAAAIGACRALRTYQYQNTEKIGPVQIHFFRNASPNSYLVTDERYTIAIAGTLIRNNMHGTTAINSLLTTLHQGKQLRDLFDEFRGPYTLIVVDRFAREISILNSREGLRNCYVSTRNGKSAYSTNLLLLAALTDATPCAAGVREFIHVGATMEVRTIFENVERLNPAALHTYRNDRWITSRLWRVATRPADRKISHKDAARALTDMFARNFEFAAALDPGKAAADLTGGIDSRTVLCCFMKQYPRPVATTSGPEDFIDVRIARRVTRKLGIEHYWYRPINREITDERMDLAVELADGCMCPIDLLQGLPYYEEKARRFDFITGGAGGPLFKDHPYWLYEFNRIGLHREPQWSRIAKFSLVSHSIQDDFVVGFGDRILDNLTELFRRWSSEIAGTNNQKLDFVYFDLKTPAFTSQPFSLTTQLMDVFHPMLDGNNVQYSINLPPEIRVRNILLFQIVRSVRPELSWIPTNAGLPAIPPIGVYSWLRALRARQYIATPFRKLRVALFGSSRERTHSSVDIEQLRRSAYFDLLEYSSLPFSFLISSPKLSAFKDAPTRQPNQSYVIATLALQLAFQRVKELKIEAKTSSNLPKVPSIILGHDPYRN